MQQSSAESMIDSFALLPHPYDGWFARVDTARTSPVRFHYLLRAGEFGAWHRTGGRLILTHIDGAPLTVSLSDGGHNTRGFALHQDGEQSCLVAETEWRCWESLGHWSLMMVSVERVEDFLQWSLAPDDWRPAG